MTENIGDYKVLSSFYCPNTHIWYDVDDEISLLGCEADFLLLSNKLEIVNE
ncbi:hypothetical protein [uncultured Shewanella sp.]|uniref:hypothetical protein n=1 Tax=uncultured Shewanella sp. TaxID=173975 RepID=UPI00261F770E|nr:hypothetical protein [uncultured Shewanella sp.]